MASGSIVPQIDFSWIGQLPGQYEAGKLAGIRANIGDIDLSSSDSISRAAQRLAAAGDWESALKLTQLATARETAEAAKTSASLRGQLDPVSAAILANWNRTKGAPPPTVGGGGGPAEGPTLSVTPPAAAPAPALPGLPGLPGVGSVGPGASLPLPSTSASLPPSPTEALLAQAESPAPPPAPPTQLAGPVPTPDTGALPPPMPSPGAVPFLPQGPVATPAPVAPPPAAAAGPGFKPSYEGPNVEQAQKDANTALSSLFAMPPLRGMAATPQYQAALKAYNDAAARAKIDPKERAYWEEKLRTYNEGGQDFNWTDFTRSGQVAAARDAAMEKTYEGYAKKGASGRSTINQLDQMQKLMDSPAFAPGTTWGQTQLDKVRNGLSSVIATARSAGIPIPDSVQAAVDRIAEPTAAREAFSAIQRQIAIESMGGLGVGRSNADLEATMQSFGALSSTKQGLQIIYKVLRETANRSSREQMAAADYAQANKRRVTGTSYGMDIAVQDKMKDYYKDKPVLVGDNGRLTDLGKEADAELRRTTGRGLLDQGAPAAPAPTVSPRGALPQGWSVTVE